MTTNEIIEACGRAPSGTPVLVRMQGVTFAIERVTLEYDGEGEWFVEIAPNMNTTESLRP